MATLIDYFRYYQSLSDRYRLRSPAVALLHSLLEEFNTARFPESLTIRTTRLMESSGIDARSTFYDARNALAQLGLIEIKTRRASGQAQYKLPAIPPFFSPNMSVNRKVSSHIQSPRETKMRSRTHTGGINYDD